MVRKGSGGPGGEHRSFGMTRRIGGTRRIRRNIGECGWSQEPGGARSPEPGARSQGPGSRSQGPPGGARSQEPGARSHAALALCEYLGEYSSPLWVNTWVNTHLRGVSLLLLLFECECCNGIMSRDPMPGRSPASNPHESSDDEIEPVS